MKSQGENKFHGEQWNMSGNQREQWGQIHKGKGQKNEISSKSDQKEGAA